MLRIRIVDLDLFGLWEWEWEWQLSSDSSASGSRLLKCLDSDPDLDRLEHCGMWIRIEIYLRCWFRSVIFMIKIRNSV